MSPVSFLQSQCFVQPFTDEGGCVVTETSVNSCKTWASVYQRIITDLPSHSGLYKQSSPYLGHIVGSGEVHSQPFKLGQ